MLIIFVLHRRPRALPPGGAGDAHADLARLSDELLRLKVTVADVEHARRRPFDPALAAWIHCLRDAAYDADDLLDDIHYDRLADSLAAPRPGNLSTFPTTEISDVANKMLQNFSSSACRNYLKMPALIIDENEKESASFVSKNGLIEDPVSVEKERSVINPWTHEEKEVFMQMLASFGKNFSKISNFLQHKTIADCVEFYYKYHKSDSFREVKKLLDLRQQQPTSNYLGSNSRKKWNPENAASLDMLGNAASVVATHGLDYANRVEKDTAKSIIRTSCRSDVSAVAKGSLDRDGIANVSLHERESVAADVYSDANGGTSDTDEACAAEMDSPICSTESPVEMEMEVCPSADKTLQGHPLSGITFKQSETDRSDGPDIVDLTFEEGEIKAEDTKNCNIPVDHRQSIEATHQSTPSCAPIDINSSQSTGSMENREHNNQVSVHGNRAMASSTEQPVGAHLEISSSLHNVEVIEPSKASEKICTQVSSREHAPESSAPITAGNLTTPCFLPGVIQSSKVYEGICTKESTRARPLPLLRRQLLGTPCHDHAPPTSSSTTISPPLAGLLHRLRRLRVMEQLLPPPPRPGHAPLLPSDTSDADEKLLLNVLSRHQGAYTHKAAAVALPLK
ncbi:Nuclear receptor corepressor 1 [Hordeum vulgare]|nr:Nuclear receptor corepressor 1 [Hordeum vulgare]